MTYELIRYERMGPAGVITLNRPERLNAFIPAMRMEIVDALAEADADEAVRAVIFTGAGRGFCAGMDLSSGEKDAPPVVAPGDLPGEGKLVMAIWNLTKPVIGAINGHAVGAGAAMTLPMDIRIASTEAKIAFAFTKLGFVPEMGSAWFLPKIVGYSTAIEWLTTGRTLTTGEALATGLVKSVVSPDELMPSALALAEEIAGTSPLSTAIARRMCQRFQAFDDPDPVVRLDGVMVRTRVLGGDAKEALTARAEKRAPQFPDKLSQEILSRFDFG
jgi:enoyl-CoA hydratase/carnithine racemase